MKKSILSKEELDQIQAETDKMIWPKKSNCNNCPGKFERGMRWCPVCGRGRRCVMVMFDKAGEWKLKKIAELEASKIAELKASKKMSSRGRMRIARKRFQIETDDWRCHKRKKENNK